MNNFSKPAYPKIGLLIDGEWIYDRPAQCDIENPSDESILGQVPKASPKDLQDALESSARGFELWRKTPPSERAAIMRSSAASAAERRSSSGDSESVSGSISAPAMSDFNSPMVLTPNYARP